MRALAGLVVLALTGTLLTPSAAAAAAPLRVSITCDPATGVVTTAATGNLLAPGTPTAVVVEFQRRGGTRVTATTSTTLAPLPQPFTVKATTTSSGDITATGYTGAFDPAATLYYREQLVVTFRNATSGVTYATREATCDQDRRTTVTLTCDPAAGTVTAAFSGVDGRAGSANGAGRPARLGYHTARTVQQRKSDPSFRTEQFWPYWNVERALTQAADGTWTDPGYVFTPSYTNPYLYAEEVTVGIYDAYGAVVGWGTAKCTLIDGSVPAAA
ncbi:hypothetical protein GCM10020358_30090 [Amorphoplanes nipponensis]